MSMMPNGQAKCDKCGILDGDLSMSNILVEGWQRFTSFENMKYGETKHFCPSCRKQTK